MSSSRLASPAIAVCCALLMVAAAFAAAPRGSRVNPVPVRRAFKIPGSDGWKVRVNKSIPNATRLVLQKNMFNDPPPAGRQFFMINVTVLYSGAGKSSSYEGVTFKALGKSNVAYDYSDDCGVVPAELEEFKTVYSGGSLSGNVCFSVRKMDVSSLLLLIEPGFSFEDVSVFFRMR